MKKKLIALSVLSAMVFTANVHAAKAGESYTEIGVSSISVELKDVYKAENYTFFTIGGGYHITDNVAIQITGYVPISAETQGTIQDTERKRVVNPDDGTVDFGNWNPDNFQDISSTAYDSTFESKGMITADFKLTIPLHEWFSVFAKVGYTYASFKVTGYDFYDNAPLPSFDGSEGVCEITGNEKDCLNLNTKANSISGDKSGVSYGAGFALHLANNSSFVFSYNQYLDKDDLNAKGFQANYQWKF